MDEGCNEACLARSPFGPFDVPVLSVVSRQGISFPLDGPGWPGWGRLGQSQTSRAESRSARWSGVEAICQFPGLSFNSVHTLPGTLRPESDLSPDQLQ